MILSKKVIKWQKALPLLTKAFLYFYALVGIFPVTFSSGSIRQGFAGKYPSPCGGYSCDSALPQNYG